MRYLFLLNPTAGKRDCTAELAPVKARDQYENKMDSGGAVMGKFLLAGCRTRI